MTHFSLCSGIGGIDLAAEWAGFTTIGQCEIDPYACKVLAKNFKGVKNYGDIRTITAEHLTDAGIMFGDITVLSAGFPCQPYSLAGKGLGDGDERDLWDEVARVIGELRPRWFVGENTPGLFARANQSYFRRVIQSLTEMGYCASWGIWGACDVGAPHKRDRVFIVAYADSMRESQPQGCKQNKRQRTGYICKNVANTTGIYAQRHYNQQRQEQFGRSSWWKIEPNVGRVADGIPSRVDRLRCLGNAVVPHQVYPVFKAIADIEKGLTIGHNI